MPDADILEEIRERLGSRRNTTARPQRPSSTSSSPLFGEQWPPELQTQRDIENRRV